MERSGQGQDFLLVGSEVIQKAVYFLGTFQGAIFKYAPRNGTILLCDFTGTAPEMVKRRPVVLLSSVAPRLCIVAPLSTAKPDFIKPWHYLLRLPEPLPGPYKEMLCWTKCDMVAVVSFDRLNLPIKGKDKSGNRLYQIITIPAADLQAIREAVWSAISEN